MKKIIETAKTSAAKARESARRFRQEVRKTIGSSLIAAFGLVTGLAWKEVVEIYLKGIISPEHSKLFTAIVITLLSVAAIMLISKILVNEEKKIEEKKTEENKNEEAK